MKIIHLDFSRATTAEELQDELAAAFSFPAWYGRNLDALHDMLTEITADTRIEYTGLAQSPARDAARRVLRVIRDAAEENEHLRLSRL